MGNTEATTARLIAGGPVLGAVARLLIAINGLTGDGSGERAPRVAVITQAPATAGESSPASFVTSGTVTSHQHSADASPIAVLTRFEIELEDEDGVFFGLYGDRVGRDLYKLSDDLGILQLGVRWYATRSDGTRMNGDNCQIVLTVDGPDIVPATRWAESALSRVSVWSDSDSIFTAHEPGTYVASAVDELTGTNGVRTIQVSPASG